MRLSLRDAKDGVRVMGAARLRVLEALAQLADSADIYASDPRHQYHGGMALEIQPTDPDREKSLGRVALWLGTADLVWLSKHCCCPEDAPAEQRERCARIRFRAGAALHKAGIGRPPYESA